MLGGQGWVLATSRLLQSVVTLRLHRCSMLKPPAVLGEVVKAVATEKCRYSVLVEKAVEASVMKVHRNPLSPWE